MSDADAVQRVARATCARMHADDLASGYLVRPLRDPGQYKAKTVWPVICAAFASGVVQERASGLLEVRDE